MILLGWGNDTRRGVSCIGEQSCVDSMGRAFDLLQVCFCAIESH